MESFCVASLEVNGEAEKEKIKNICLEKDFNIVSECLYLVSVCLSFRI